jgi:hypothetical protein
MAIPSVRARRSGDYLCAAPKRTKKELTKTAGLLCERAAEDGSVPLHEGLGADNRDGLED